MRKKGSNTQKICWRCEVVNQNQILFSGEFATLKQIAHELGLSYSQVVELSSGRKKDNKGRYDTNYRLTKLSEKLNNEEVEVVESSDEETINPSMNGLTS
jgi:hypothetical protein